MLFSQCLICLIELYSSIIHLFLMVYQNFSTWVLLTFWHVDIIAIWGWIIVCGGCPVHRRMFRSVSGLYALDASRICSPPTPHPMDNLKYLQTFPDVPWVGEKSPPVKSHWFIFRLPTKSQDPRGLCFYLPRVSQCLEQCLACTYPRIIVQIYEWIDIVSSSRNMKTNPYLS